MAKKEKKTTIWGADTKTEAENVATGHRRSLKKDGLPWRGRVQVRRAAGGRYGVVVTGPFVGRTRRYLHGRST